MISVITNYLWLNIGKHCNTVQFTHKFGSYISKHILGCVLIKARLECMFFLFFFSSHWGQAYWLQLCQEASLISGCLIGDELDIIDSYYCQVDFFSVGNIDLEHGCHYFWRLNLVPCQTGSILNTIINDEPFPLFKYMHTHAHTCCICTSCKCNW